MGVNEIQISRQRLKQKLTTTTTKQYFFETKATKSKASYYTFIIYFEKTFKKLNKVLIEKKKGKDSLQKHAIFSTTKKHYVFQKGKSRVIIAMVKNSEDTEENFEYKKL